MPLEYTNKPVKLHVVATLEFEDGQSFTFERALDDFNEENPSVLRVAEEVSDDIYEKLEEFIVENEDDDDDYPDYSDEDDDDEDFDEASEEDTY